MQYFPMISMLQILVLFGYFCSGIQEDKCLVIGIWNPVSLMIIKEIPKSPISSFSGVTHLFANKDSIIYSMASDPNKMVIFLAISNTIYMYHNFSCLQHTSKESLTKIRSKSASPGHIAFDFVSSNLYWCDSLLNWIAMKPAYNFNDRIYKVIVQKDLRLPEGLALDPEDRLMFFSDNYPTSQIERSTLDGEDRAVIVYRGLSRVYDLSLDTVNDKLYWSDYFRQSIEGSDYDGSNRIVIRRENRVSVSGLAYYQNMLHAVNFGHKRMFAVDKTSGAILYFKEFSSKQPVVIDAYDAETRTYSNNPCSSLNCHHMCVNTKSGPKCLCSEGYQLERDGKTCKRSSPFYERGFVVSNASMIVIHDIQSAYTISDTVIRAVIPSSVIETFAVDAQSDIIYFVDSKSISLKKYDIITKNLIFDWIANLLGWIEPKESSIRSFSVNSQITVTIYSNLQNPASLTVDPNNGVLYWISGTTERSIVRGSWKRDTPTVLVSAENLNNPKSLQFDVTFERIYWLDGGFIKSSMRTGSDIKSHVITNEATQSIVYKLYYVWIKGDRLFFVRDNNVRSAPFETITIENSTDVAVFDSFLQHDKRDSCSILNGGCGEICLPEGNRRRCECDIGLQLQIDQSCGSDVLTSNFIAVVDYSHDRIFQIDLQIGTVVKLPLSIRKSTGLAFDMSTKTFFFSSTQMPYTIMSTPLNGKNTVLFYEIGFGYAMGLAIDHSTGNIYYGAIVEKVSHSYIGVVHRATSIHKTLINNIDRPRDIALFSSKGYLFWIDAGNRTAICRIHMDGTAKSYIATTDLQLPRGLTIDYSSSRLYWTDGHTNRIEHSDLNGGNRRVLATDTDAFLNDIVIHGDNLYYTAWHRELITKMHKETGSKLHFMSKHPELGRLDSLDIFANEIRDVSSSCSRNNGLCSTFCFPTPTGRTCGCEDNVDLQPDQLTCEGVFRCNTLQQNVTFINCPLPYPGLSCEFKCKAGYQRVLNTTLVCDSGGQWKPTIDTVCEAIEKTEETYLYLYIGSSASGAFVAVMVIVGIVCFVKRHNKSGNSHQETLSDTQNDQYQSCGSYGYSRPYNDYHSIVSMSDIINHDEDGESVTSPYLDPIP